jgi:RimJ/RimL family protein N-acetyltransferase
VRRYQPSLQTDRLRLRPFIADDAEEVHRLAGAREIADTTNSIPHPYSLAAAKTWIANLPHYFRAGKAVHFALTLRDSGELIGAAALHDIDSKHSQAELGFWVGLPWWGLGYATEAARECLRFGFRELSLNRIYAYHMARNPQAGNLLRKLGMKQEGILRQRLRKWGVFEDVVLYAILREDANTA